MAKKKPTTKKKSVVSKKAVKKKVETPKKVVKPAVEATNEVPTEVTIEKKVCFVAYVPPKRLWSDKRHHPNPDDHRFDSNPFLGVEEK